MKKCNHATIICELSFMKSGLREFASFHTELQIRDGAIHHVDFLRLLYFESSERQVSRSLPRSYEALFGHAMRLLSSMMQTLDPPG